MKSGGKIRRKRGERWREKDIENEWVIKKEDKKKKENEKDGQRHKEKERE